MMCPYCEGIGPCSHCKVTGTPEEEAREYNRKMRERWTPERLADLIVERLLLLPEKSEE